MQRRDAASFVMLVAILVGEVWLYMSLQNLGARMDGADGWRRKVTITLENLMRQVERVESKGETRDGGH